MRRLSRAAGRGGGTTLPGRLLLRAEPRALERMAGELDRGAVLVSGDQRQDHHGRDGGRDPGADAAGPWCTTPPARTWPGAWQRPCSTPSAAGASSASSRSTRRGCRRWRAPCKPDVYLLANLFRDQLDRYGELELIADRWAELVAEQAGSARFVLNADDPLVADLGRGHDGVVYFGVEDDSQALAELGHAADSKHCRNCGTPVRVRDRPARAHGPLPLPGLRSRAPATRGLGERRSAGRDVGRALHAWRCRPGEIEVELPLPGLYNVYNALAATALALELGASLEHVREGPRGLWRRVRPRRDDPGRRPRPVSILLVKNPAGANEVLRTLTLEDGELDLWIALNDGIADGRDVSWIWDADFEVLAGRVRHVTCSGTRAEEMALRLKYAGIEVEPAVDRDLGRSLDQPWPRVERAALRCTPFPPTPRCWSCASCLRAAGLPGRWADEPRTHGALSAARLRLRLARARRRPRAL